jgi:hypothetical protein
LQSILTNAIVVPSNSIAPLAQFFRKETKKSIIVLCPGKQRPEAHWCSTSPIPSMVPTMRGLLAGGPQAPRLGDYRPEGIVGPGRGRISSPERSTRNEAQESQ